MRFVASTPLTQVRSNGTSFFTEEVYKKTETKYFKQEPIQRRFDFSDVLYFGWPNQPSSGTMRVYIELLLCTYIYIVNGC